MVIKVSKALLDKQRTIQVGYGVVMTFKPFKFSEYKEVEAWARRTAQEELTREQKAALAGMEVEELGDEFKDRLIGLAEQMVLDRLVTNFCQCWEGIESFEEDPDQSEPLPYSISNWPLIRDSYPILADSLLRKLADPMLVVSAEGNASAPFPNTSAAAV